MNDPNIYFNSIKVRLKLLAVKHMTFRMINFNSIKVRLKRYQASHHDDGNQFQFHKGTIKTRWLYRWFHCWPVFQFHKGTIKTFYRRIGKKQRRIFQFHKGTIKTPLGRLTEIKRCYFNSIKVRLKHTRYTFVFVFVLFQFHKGTIKTSPRWSTCTNRHISIP